MNTRDLKFPYALSEMRANLVFLRSASKQSATLPLPWGPSLKIAVDFFVNDWEVDQKFLKLVGELFHNASEAEKARQLTLSLNSIANYDELIIRTEPPAVSAFWETVENLAKELLEMILHDSNGDGSC